jgi:hypothetical protein
MPLLIALTLTSALVCYFVARSRSADRRFWTVMGLLLGPLALPFVLFARPIGSASGRRGESAYTDADDRRTADGDRQSADERERR